MKSSTVLVIVGCILVGLILFGFGISEIVLWENRFPYVSGNCTTFPDLDKFSATKSLSSQWRWKYKFDQFSGKIEHTCPSTKADVNVYVGGKIVARSDGKIATTTSRTYINDCNGNTIYKTQTASAWETIINQNKIIVSFLLKDPQDNVLAYVEGEHFFSDDIEIKDVNGKTVANMKRDKLTLSKWKWEFTRIDKSHPGSDPRVLTTIAGKKSFSENDETDVCNQYFYGVAWAFLAVAIAIFCGLCYLGYKWVRKNIVNDGSVNIPVHDNRAWLRANTQPNNLSTDRSTFDEERSLAVAL